MFDLNRNPKRWR